MAGSTPGTPQVLRAMNDRTALELLLSEGPLSRSRIGTLTGLSKPTASQLLSRLEDAGLVVVTGTSEGRPGPNAQLYAINPDVAHVAGIDVTTACIRAAVADITGRTIGTYEVPTPAEVAQDAQATDTEDGHDSSASRTVSLVVQAVDGAAKAAGVHRGDLRRIVIGTPGAFDPSTGQLRYASHLPGWHSPSLLRELAAALPMPLEYDNDVNLAAVAEQRHGAAAGHEDFVLLWNEQGIGAALVLGGRLHRGYTGGAGELGFLPVPGAPLVRDPARVNEGGFQTLAGANAVLHLADELALEYDKTAELHDAATALVARAALMSEDEAEAAGPDGDGGGPHSALLQRFAAGLAVGLASLITVLDPQLIVLSGGMLTAGGETLRELVRDELSDIAVPRPHLVLGTITDQPVLNGALESALIATREEVFDTFN